MKSVSIFLFVLSFMFISSCSEENLSVNDENRLSQSEVNNIGALHNDYVEQGFNNFDYSASDRVTELKENFFTNHPNFSENDLEKKALMRNCMVINLPIQILWSFTIRYLL